MRPSITIPLPSWKLLALTGLLGFNQCLDTITIDLDSDTIDNLVINGKLVKGNPSYAVAIISRVIYYNPGNENPLNVKYVDIVDDLGNRIPMFRTEAYKYEISIPQNDPVFQIEEGRRYGIIITTSEKTYASDLDELLPVTPILDVSYSVGTEHLFESNGPGYDQDVVNFSASSSLIDLNQNPSRIRWEAAYTYAVSDTAHKTCYVNQSIIDDQIRIYDGSSVQAAMVNEQLYQIPVSYDFAEGFYLTLYQEALSVSAYSYWEKVKTIIERNGNMFEVPAGKIQGNLHNEADPSELVFGNFYVTQQETFRLYVDPADVGNPVTYCPYGPYVNGERIYTECAHNCCDCLRAANSTTTKPDFWKK